MAHGRDSLPKRKIVKFSLSKSQFFTGSGYDQVLPTDIEKKSTKRKRKDSDEEEYKPSRKELDLEDQETLPAVQVQDEQKPVSQSAPVPHQDKLSSIQFKKDLTPLTLVQLEDHIFKISTLKISDRRLATYLGSEETAKIYNWLTASYEGYKGPLLFKFNGGGICDKHAQKTLNRLSTLRVHDSCILQVFALQIAFLRNQREALMRLILSPQAQAIFDEVAERIQERGMVPTLNLA